MAVTNARTLLNELRAAHASGSHGFLCEALYNAVQHLLEREAVSWERLHESAARVSQPSVPLNMEGVDL